MECGPSGQGEKPEPQKDINLLIDNIDGQNTQMVGTFHGTRRTILVKSTLGHLREHLQRNNTLKNPENYDFQRIFTLAMGSTRSSKGNSLVLNTSRPYWVNWPFRKKSMK